MGVFFMFMLDFFRLYQFFNNLIITFQREKSDGYGGFSYRLSKVIF